MAKLEAAPRWIYKKKEKVKVIKKKYRISNE
jgi:hypothetical protein